MSISYLYHNERCSATLYFTCSQKQLCELIHTAYHTEAFEIITASHQYVLPSSTTTSTFYCPSQNFIGRIAVLTAIQLTH